VSTEHGDWRRLTAKETELIRTAKPDQLCILRDEQVIRAKKAAVMAVYEHAFKSAAHQACQQLGIVSPDQLTDLDCEPCDGFVCVTATDGQGKTATAVAQVADPREN
jgi:hypothetical protein